MKQKIIVTALPNGLATRGTATTWKISAAIGLQVEDADTTLNNVKDMLGWATLVKNAKFIVQLNGSTVEAKVVSKPVDTELWKNLFLPTVKVKSFVQEDLSKIPIASYPVKHVLTYIKGVVEQTGKNFSKDLPDSNYYTENPILTAISDYSVAEFPKRGRNKVTLESLVLNRQTGKRLKGILNSTKSIPFNTSPDPTMDFAQVKNFHGLYDAKEVATWVQGPKPDFEFHQILSVLGGYPQLMRKLGLVFDLEFTVPSTLLMSVQPTIRIIPSAINFTIPTNFVCPATAYTKTTSGFYAKPLAGSPIDKGHLKITTDAFTVFQVDTDGAALKLCQQVDALQLKKAKHIFYAYEGMMPGAAAIPLYNNEAPRKEGLPSHRSAGIAVARNGMAENLSKKFQRMNDLKGLLVTGTGAPAGVSGTNASWVLTTEVLFADDVNLGYRMDVQTEDKAGKWFSLHKRNNKYSFLNSTGTTIDIPGMEADEGFIQTSATEEKTDTGTQLKVGEAIARWEGWSLSVPRPGSSLNDPMLDKQEVYDKTKPGNTEKENAKYKTPGTADFRLNIQPGIEKGSLPMLRFGKRYSIRIRTVDLAGNSVPVETNPEDEGNAVMKNIRYMRYEPVDAPFLMLGNDVKDGESSEVMVIRSNEGVTPEQFENSNIESVYGKARKPDAVRHVKPPRTTVEMSATHSMLDKGFGPANDAQAAAIYAKIKNDKDPFTKEEDATYELKVIDPALSTIPVEYLADPMAAGVTFFISVNDPNFKLPDPEVVTRRVSFFFDEEVVNEAQANKPASYDEWMNPKTFRIVLKEGAPNIKWESTSRTMVVTMQKGLIAKFNYACFWRPNDIIKFSGILEMMGMNNLADAVGQRVAKGQHWMFSPWREITFVHAIQQPVSKFGTQNFPEIATLIPDREYGANNAKLNSKLMVHGPSTGQLDMEADWIEWVDDITKPALEKIPTKSKVFHYTTLYAIFEYVFGELVKDNPFPAISHLFNDTKHRRVNYKTIATTRYREYFNQLKLDKKDAFPLTRDSKTISNVIIPSSARPAAPQVEYVIPNFEWDRAEKGALTITGRGSGIRVYLKRPWYSSGEGEQLAVVLPLPVLPQLGGVATSSGASYTVWGTDPTKLSGPLPTLQGMVSPFQDSFINVKAENKENNLSVVENSTAKVNIVAYDVKYDAERQLYYADIMINILTAYYPFVKLGLARYQKHSLRKNGTDCCLSPVVMTDFIQIPAPRFSSIQLGSSKNQITVAISGSVPNVDTFHPFFRSKVEFVIESIDVPVSENTHITINERPVDSYSYVLTAADVKNFAFMHSHVFNLPPEWATRPYRVKVLEYEVIIYDHLKPKPAGQPNLGTMPMKDRLVFADVYEVNK